MMARERESREAEAEADTTAQKDSTEATEKRYEPVEHRIEIEVTRDIPRGVSVRNGVQPPVAPAHLRLPSREQTSLRPRRTGRGYLY